MDHIGYIPSYIRPTFALLGNTAYCNEANGVLAKYMLTWLYAAACQRNACRMTQVERGATLMNLPSTLLELQCQDVAESAPDQVRLGRFALALVRDPHSRSVCAITCVVMKCTGNNIMAPS